MHPTCDNKNIDNKFSVLDIFLEQPSSGTHIIKRLKNQINSISFRAGKPKGPNKDSQNRQNQLRSPMTEGGEPQLQF